MERFALLIEASDVDPSNDLPGAREDIRHWKDFLQSELGGSWRYSKNESNSEITVRSSPYSSDVEALLKANSHKYCFVAFAGHGFHDKKGGDYVCLNKSYMSCPIDKITPKSRQGTLVVDACRTFDDAYVSTSIQAATSRYRKNLIIANEATEIRSLSSESRITSFSNVYYSDKNWSKHFVGCGTGIVKMLSCAKGEAADDIRVNGVEKGGIYTTILMKSAMNWKKRASSSKVYKTKDAHDDTVRYMTTNFPEQHPEYTPLHIAYPFAIK